MHLIGDERESDSPYIERVWSSRSDHAEPFISMANAHWGMVITRYQGQLTLTVRGPETRATAAHRPADAEWIGIQFKPGTLMPHLPAGKLMDRRDVNLPEAGSRSFWLNGSAWQFPDYDNMETFVARLARDGLLISDSVVNATLLGQPAGLSLRTVQRRFLQATGLTQNTVFQIERARYATRLLTHSVPILDAVDLAGYADQPHLTRSLKRLIGKTPAQVASESHDSRLSLLFKTEPF